MTPGSLALLAEHSVKPGVTQRLAAALRGPRAEIRTAAARVAHVGFARAGPADLVAALPRK
jgi:hypothetical protein